MLLRSLTIHCHVIRPYSVSLLILLEVAVLVVFLEYKEAMDSEAPAGRLLRSNSAVSAQASEILHCLGTSPQHIVALRV